MAFSKFDISIDGLHAGLIHHGPFILCAHIIFHNFLFSVDNSCSSRNPLISRTLLSDIGGCIMEVSSFVAKNIVSVMVIVAVMGCVFISGYIFKLGLELNQDLSDL